LQHIHKEQHSAAAKAGIIMSFLKMQNEKQDFLNWDSQSPQARHRIKERNFWQKQPEEGLREGVAGP
jgi:hypothetical protein